MPGNQKRLKKTEGEEQLLKGEGKNEGFKSKYETINGEAK